MYWKNYIYEPKLSRHNIQTIVTSISKNLNEISWMTYELIRARWNKYEYNRKIESFISSELDSLSTEPMIQDDEVSIHSTRVRPSRSIKLSFVYWPNLSNLVIQSNVSSNLVISTEYHLDIVKGRYEYN